MIIPFLFSLLFASLVAAKEHHKDFHHKVILLGRKSHNSNAFQIQLKPLDALSLQLNGGVSVSYAVLSMSDDIGDEKKNLITTKMNLTTVGFGGVLYSGPSIDLTSSNRLKYSFSYEKTGDKAKHVTHKFKFDPTKYLLPQIHSELVGGFKDEVDQFVYRIKADITEELNSRIVSMKVIMIINKAHDSSEIVMSPAEELMQSEDINVVSFLSNEGVILTAGDIVTYYFTYLASKDFPWASTVAKAPSELWSNHESWNLDKLQPYQTQAFSYTVSEPKLGHDFEVAITKKPNLIKQKRIRIWQSKYRVTFAMPNLIPTNIGEHNETNRVKVPVVDFRYRMNKGDHFVGYFMKFDYDKHVWYYDNLRIFLGMEIRFFFSYKDPEDPMKLVNTEIMSYGKDKVVRDQYSDNRELVPVALPTAASPYKQRVTLGLHEHTLKLTFALVSNVLQDVTKTVIKYKRLDQPTYRHATMRKENPIKYTYTAPHLPLRYNDSIQYVFEMTKDDKTSAGASPTTEGVLRRHLKEELTFSPVYTVTVASLIQAMQLDKKIPLAVYPVFGQDRTQDPDPDPDHDHDHDTKIIVHSATPIATLALLSTMLVLAIVAIIILAVQVCCMRRRRSGPFEAIRNKSTTKWSVVPLNNDDAMDLNHNMDDIELSEHESPGFLPQETERDTLI